MMIVVALRFLNWDQEARRAVTLAHATSSELSLTVLNAGGAGPG